MGRRNLLFNRAEVGAQQVGVIQSLRLPAACTASTLTLPGGCAERVSLHTVRDVEELTPRQWKELLAHNPLNPIWPGWGSIVLV